MSAGRMKTWNVRVHTGDGSMDLGQVQEETEELARCAALSKFGIAEDDANAPARGIGLEDDFDVSQA